MPILVVSCQYLRLAGPPQLLELPSQDEKSQKLRQLFGNDFKDLEEQELSRVTKVVQPRRQPLPPEWASPRPDGLSTAEWAVQRMTSWLEDQSVDMSKIFLVPVQDRRIGVVVAESVLAGGTLFEVPDRLLVTAEAAFMDPDVGRDLRIMSSKNPGEGFGTFAIATLLAVEHVRRGAVKGVLRRLDGGVLGGGTVLPQWEVDEAEKASRLLQSNRDFSPFIDSLDWPGEEECLVDIERAEAVMQGAALIAQIIEPAARNAWMKATQRTGLAQATSDEDCLCTATQALLLAMETQLDPPPPLREPDGERRWGGEVQDGPALCPLVNCVLPPPDVAIAARAAGAFNAQLGRPLTGRVDTAIRCIATRDLSAGTVILADLPNEQ